MENINPRTANQSSQKTRKSARIANQSSQKTRKSARIANQSSQKTRKSARKDKKTPRKDKKTPRKATGKIREISNFHPNWNKEFTDACLDGNVKNATSIITNCNPKEFHNSLNWNRWLSDACYGGHVEMVEFVIDYFNNVVAAVKETDKVDDTTNDEEEKSFLEKGTQKEKSLLEKGTQKEDKKKEDKKKEDKKKEDKKKEDDFDWEIVYPGEEICSIFTDNIEQFIIPEYVPGSDETRLDESMFTPAKKDIVENDVKVLDLNFGLQAACESGHIKIVQYLIELSDMRFLMNCHKTNTSQHGNTFRMLVANELDWNLGLASACNGGHIEIAEQMVEMGAHTCCGIENCVLYKIVYD